MLVDLDWRWLEIPTSSALNYHPKYCILSTRHFKFLSPIGMVQAWTNPEESKSAWRILEGTENSETYFWKILSLNGLITAQAAEVSGGLDASQQSATYLDKVAMRWDKEEVYIGWCTPKYASTMKMAENQGTEQLKPEWKNRMQVSKKTHGKEELLTPSNKEENLLSCRKEGKKLGDHARSNSSNNKSNNKFQQVSTSNNNNCFSVKPLGPAFPLWASYKVGYGRSPPQSMLGCGSFHFLEIPWKVSNTLWISLGSVGPSKLLSFDGWASVASRGTPLHLATSSFSSWGEGPTRGGSQHTQQKKRTDIYALQCLCMCGYS